MKKRVYILICIGCMFLTACKTTSKNLSSIFNVSVSENIHHHSYSEVEKFKISWDEIFAIDLDRYFVYFYSKTCSHCNSLKDFIIETALSRGDIYFVEASEKVVIENSQNSSNLSNEFSILGYPTLIEILNEKVVQKITGEIDIKIALSFLN